MTPADHVRRSVAIARWRLAVLTRSLRFVPPLLGELATLLVLFASRPQAASSVVSVSAVVVFVATIWCSTASAAGVAGSAHDITIVTSGWGATLAGEVLADAAVAGAASIIILAASAAVTRPVPGPAAWLVGWVAVWCAGLTGAALAQLVTALGLRGPARFVLLLAAVVVTLARPAMADGRALAKAVAWVVPPVLAFVKTLDDGFPDALGGALAVSAACVAWAAVVTAVTAVVGARWPDRRHAADR
jgi:hypothetical protein